MLPTVFPEFWAMRKPALEKLLAETLAGGKVLSAASPGGSEDQGYRLDHGGLAVVPISGALFKEFHCPPYFSSYVALRDILQAALDNPQAKAVLLDINSPGGTVAGCEDLMEFVFAARGRKPLYAWTDSQASSGAYWLGSAAGFFAASASAEVGSIGVVWAHCDSTLAAEKIGLKFTVLRAGEFKALGNELEPLDPKARQVVQETLDGMYAIFRSGVARNRGLAEGDFKDWAEGREFLARDAVASGLVDRVCSREEFVSQIQQEVNMDEKELREKFPEVALAIEQAARKDAESKAKAAADEALKGAQAAIIALAGTLFGEEDKERLAAAVEANLSAEAAQKLGLGKKPEEPDGDGKQEMLAAIQGLDQGGVQTRKPGAAGRGNPLAAAIRKRHNLKE